MKKMDLEVIGKGLMLAGLVVAIVGAGLWVVARTGLPLGKLPGDIRYEGNGFSFYFPITTTILLSIALTVILNLILRLLKK
jgi:hypothetical protein